MRVSGDGRTQPFCICGQQAGVLHVQLSANRFGLWLVCRITLSDATISGVLAITGSAELWLTGDNTIETEDASAVTCSDALTLCGTGTLVAEDGSIWLVDLVERECCLKPLG